MSLLRRLLTVSLLIAAAVIAFYAFIWIIVFLAIAIPVGLMYFSWKRRRGRRARDRNSGVVEGRVKEES